ncbi:MAG: gamma-glutamylcyclotransferase [Verrucomicrobiota bacterium]|nr:gamma-glutamylcyclotransferase [Verrucomicrobiota bacterium]
MANLNMNADAIRISADKTVADWKALRVRLIESAPRFATPDVEEVFNLFKVRIETRFLRPIHRILEIRENLGEGMAAAALECILIEHLEATFQGKLYAEPRSAEEIKELAGVLRVSDAAAAKLTQPCRYISSASLFESFLTRHEPFNRYFNKRSASVFFTKVRCGLLHEAATKDQTVVRKECAKDPNQPVEMRGNRNLILYRTPFLRGIEECLARFRQELSANPERVIGLIRKLDEICQIPKVFYFAYGRNLNRQILKQRAGRWVWAQSAAVADFKVVFDKQGLDGTKANLSESPNTNVWGVCYELDALEGELGFENLKQSEAGYEIRDVLVSFPPIKEQFIAKTFIAIESVKSQRPSRDYLDDILTGAKDWQLPKEYIEQLKRAAEYH